MIAIKAYHDIYAIPNGLHAVVRVVCDEICKDVVIWHKDDPTCTAVCLIGRVTNIFKNG